MVRSASRSSSGQAFVVCCALLLVEVNSLDAAQQDVTFANGNVTLAGTLTTPAEGGPFPAVVMVTGSGAQNRDEEVFGFRIFGVMARDNTEKDEEGGQLANRREWNKHAPMPRIDAPEPAQGNT